MSKLSIVMYHYVRDLRYSRYPEIKGLDVELFKQQLDFFEANFNIVTMEQVIAAKYDEESLPNNAMLLTFDDGYIDHFTMVFPILKNRGLQGSFFIPGKTFTEDILLDVNKIHFILASTTSKQLIKDLYELLNRFRKDYPELLSNEELFEKYGIASRFDSAETIFCKRVLQTAIPEQIRNRISSILFEKYVGIPEKNFARELYMNRDQIRCMKETGMFIGLHGYDHYWLGNLPQEKMCQDIDKSLEIMDEFIDPDNWVMNYPYGNQNEQVVEYIRKKGCKIGFTTEARIANLEEDYPLLLPRFDCNDFPPRSENYKVILL